MWLKKQKGKCVFDFGHLVIGLVAVLIQGSEISGAEKVLLGDVSMITLEHGKITAWRRSSPVPQLACVGGSAKNHYNPKVVQCFNRGSDGSDYQWECKADMDTSFRFGSVEVLCEGYDHPDDPYVLEGSCGLEYTIDLTEEGIQKYQQQKTQHQHREDPAQKKKQEEDLFKLVCFLFLVGGGIIKFIWHGWRGGGGGGGGGGAPAPPPQAPEQHVVHHYHGNHSQPTPCNDSGNNHTSTSYGGTKRREPATSPSSSSSSSSSSSTKHTSSGYGGTKRR